MISAVYTCIFISLVVESAGQHPQSCNDANHPRASDMYMLYNDNNQSFTVFCDYHPEYTDTYVNLNSSVDVDPRRLFNNHTHVNMRTLWKDGTQRDTLISQLPAFQQFEISVQFNDNVGYVTPIEYTQKPYLYVGLLPDNGTIFKGLAHGYRANDHDVDFVNCDGTGKNYFTIYRKGAHPTQPYLITDTYVLRAWVNVSTPVPQSKYIPDDLFTFFEVHMGGCGAFGTLSQFPEIVGAALGLRNNRIDCGFPSRSVPFCVFSFTGTTVGHVTTYSCYPGYVHTSGDLTRTCTAFGTWSGREATCAQSCNDVNHPRASGMYTLYNDKNQSFTVFCDYHPQYTDTYVNLNLSVDVDPRRLFNNHTHVNIRTLWKDGTQRDTLISQLPAFQQFEISVQFNDNVGYVAPMEYTQKPYLYVGLLPDNGTIFRGLAHGYRANDQDVEFVNCDGNGKNYFTIYGKGAHSTQPYLITDAYVLRAWVNVSSPVPQSEYIPDDLFTFFEVHMGGCGALGTLSQFPGPLSQFPEMVGAALGLRYNRIECGFPSRSVPFGVFTFTGTTVGHVTTYSCYPGYVHTSGDLTRTCTALGTWSGREATCALDRKCDRVLASFPLRNSFP